MEQFKGHFYIRQGDHKTYPDEFPIIIKDTAARKAITLFDELDRATEDTEKIIDKLTRYRDIWYAENRNTILYGFPGPFLRFITTSEVRKRHLMEKTAHLFGGKCGFILWSSIRDHTVRRFTQPVTSQYFDEPYERIGLPPFSIKMMREV